MIVTRHAPLSEQTVLKELTPNTDIVPSSFDNDEFDNGQTTSFGVAAGSATDNTRTYLGHNGVSIIRRNGLIESFKLQTGANFASRKDEVVSLEIVIYRKMQDGFYDEIGTADITTEYKAETSNLTDITIDISASNIHVLIGDRVAFRIITNGNNAAGILSALDGGNAASTYFLDGTLATTNIDFEGTGTANDGVIRGQVLMRAPWGLWVSDSSGEDASQKGFFNKADINITYDEMISQRLQNDGFIGLEIDNSSLGATSRIAVLNTDIQTRILDMKPKVCFIALGSNDVSQGTAIETMQSGYLTLIESLISNDIKPVLIKVAPRTDLTDAEHGVRNTFNSYVQTVGDSKKLLVIDLEGALGQLRADIDTFNMWDIKTSYNLDDTHINTTGQVAFVNEFYTQFIAHEKSVKLLNNMIV